ncbi:ornithine carbamoyltransferase [Candidatus Thioglobus sp.]|jgi:ornithine carbamoyltransferase|uniref:ornithine carbamoyltransferase n=1 Tax=Candidatus Thioglobus sp. TaxID=2026721 RepID=UPI0001BD394D|nr:ornithine carbamoyltransferase [Candidatus Thioglobus sp.]EEZ79617.1 MAG: ornithine carbamoyltransferase [uncultured Candidatus Thioglobus sp.]MBT3186418.1 ornithine carbamoyltransferase [Candidatus Thioglobus sp.]MBT3432032.1 ornithine carbamoyltransferase [Candidatus Thioglobus sp.]MBT4316200.1 ornithine carbamoyltransferase [Candidatus Thioglobus sp.]MBT4923480.1 ornithine carbamoyltransferase [Candidatus Thioglobus sp.]
MTKHFINLNDLSNNDLQQIIDQAIALKKQHKSGEINNALQNKTLAMIFDKSSTRTRVSFEAGMTQLGGHALFLSDRDIQLGRGEPIIDSAIVISSMVDAIMMRVSSHDDITTFSQHSSVPIINALSDESHPCQLLADMMTYQEYNGSIKGKTVAWIGDGNNMCHTYMQAAKAFGFTLNIATPKGYEPEQSFVSQYADFINLCADAQTACDNADLVVTDVWASMGQESEQTKRETAFKDFQVNTALMESAKSNAIFMHCLPAHRGEEVSANVIDGKQSLVWNEAENRLHAQKALLLFLLG